MIRPRPTTASATAPIRPGVIQSTPLQASALATAAARIAWKITTGVSRERGRRGGSGGSAGSPGVLGSGSSQAIGVTPSGSQPEAVGLIVDGSGTVRKGLADAVIRCAASPSADVPGLEDGFAESCSTT